MLQSHTMMASFFGTEFLDPEQLVDLRNQGECGYAKVHWKDFLNPRYLVEEFLPKIASYKKLRYFSGLVLRSSALPMRYVRPNSS
mgnify:CR=1 FL=1